MAALQILQMDLPLRIAVLDQQLEACHTVRGKQRAAIREYLLQRGIYSVEDITDEDIQDYREYLRWRADFTPKQRALYVGCIETILYAHYAPHNQQFLQELENGKKQTAVIKKTEVYLMAHGIRRAEDITYEIRVAYESYIEHSVAKSKRNEYVKALDNMKLDAIRREWEQTPYKERKLKYDGGKVFLLYHPDIEMAKTFYYVQDKTELLFDFSYAGSEIVKKQIFQMLNFILEREKNWKSRRERFLVPLKLLYVFCMEQGIADLEQLEEEEIEKFRETLDSLPVNKTAVYIQIVDNIRKFLFLQAKKTNWQANVWYLERFCLQSDRVNPANPIFRFFFLQIKIKENRRILQKYMRYMIGVTSLAVSNIRTQFYRVTEFLEYCDQNRLLVQEITSLDMDKYMQAMDDGILPLTYNCKVEDIHKFFMFMVVKGMMEKIPFEKKLYLKKVVPVHHDRALSEDIVERMLGALYLFPEHMRLMYLHLWCLGLRVNEVCVIRGNAYYEKSGEAWIRIYQNKMKAEKTLPIPKTLYALMRSYIQKMERKPDEYVFQSQKGGAYNASTYCKQMVDKCNEIGIGCGEYTFRSHDYRHTIGTTMSEEGVSLQAIRDFLGHKSEEMTKQYVDCVPKQIDKANEKYFRENSIPSKVERRKRVGTGDKIKRSSML